MSFTTIKIIQGRLSDQQKTSLIENVTQAMKGEQLKELNWEIIVRLNKGADFAVVKLSHLSQGAGNFSGRVQGSLVGQGYPLT